MTLEAINFNKNWYENSNTREANWDEIANKTAAFSIRTVNYLKQLGLDLDPSYIFNGNGQSSQVTSIIPRLTTLEAQQSVIGTKNLGLDISTTSKVKIVGSNGSNLSVTNKGLVTFPSSVTPGQFVTREIIANLEITLTGAHWGQDTFGDLNDFPLWIAFADNGTDAILCVLANGGRRTVTTGDAVTSASSATNINNVIVSSSISSELNLTYLGWVFANFDDTGNAGGENFWVIQTAVGEVNLTGNFTYLDAVGIRF